MCLMNNVSLAGQNYLPYSSYNSSGWTAYSATPTNAGTVSFGCKEGPRLRINDDNTVTVADGVQTWTGVGGFRATTEIAVSTWTTLVFTVEVGQYDQEPENLFSVTLGLTNEAEATPIVLGTWTDISMRKLWGTTTAAALTTAGLTAVCPYVVSTSDDSWWFDDARLEKDVTVPGVFLPTSGAAVSVATDTAIKSVMKVCKSCRYKFFHTYRGVIQREVQMPLDTDIEPLP